MNTKNTSPTVLSTDLLNLVNGYKTSFTLQVWQLGRNSLNTVGVDFLTLVCRFLSFHA
jgi:hypothetical protein